MNMFSRNPFSRDGRVSRPDDGRPAGRIGELAQRPEVRWGALALLVLLVVFAGWLGYGAMQAKSSLEQSRDYAQQAKDALLGGKAEDGTRFAENAEFFARQARSSTHSLPWNIAAAVPWLGSPFKSGQQISDVVVGLTADVLKPAAKAGVGISPDTLFADGRVNLQLLREKEPALAALSADATRLDVQAAAITKPAFISALGDARTQLQDQTSDIAGLFRNTALAARLAPSMMGADGPRTYLMGFQTPAEARGTGGLLGGFGVLRFDNGKPTVDTLGTNTELTGATATIDLGPEFNAQYGFTKPYSDFRNSNLSAHFPYAAQIWESMWEQKTGLNADGVIALDPIALGYLLSALGPITMSDGEVITEKNVVELTMSTAYARFPPQFTVFPNGDRLTRDDERKQYLQEIAKEVVKKLTGSVESPRKLLDALGKAISERRIAVWSSLTTDQKLIEQTPIANVIPDDPAPHAEIVINNLAGNKMDYYLKREIEYAADGCDGDRRNSTVTVRLTNTATSKPLPEYVAGSPGLVKGLPLSLPPGTMVTSVRLIATADAKLVGVTSGDKAVSAIVHSERGHPSFEVQVVIPPGQSGDLIFRLTEPTTPGVPRVPIQPLIDTVTPRVSVPACP
jgi:hypothetical protein